MLDEMFLGDPRCWGHGMIPRMSFGMLEAPGYMYQVHGEQCECLEDKLNIWVITSQTWLQEDVTKLETYSSTLAKSNSLGIVTDIVTIHILEQLTPCQKQCCEKGLQNRGKWPSNMHDLNSYIKQTFTS